MKKQIFSLFCALILFLNLNPIAPASALEGDAVRAADTLHTLGLLKTVNYAVKDTANRVTAAVFLVQLGGINPPAGGKSPFSDTPDWAADSLAYAAGQGWITGVEGGVFDAYGPLTSSAWFTMLLRMLGWKDSEGAFKSNNAAVFARRVGLSSRDYPASMSRGDLYESILDALAFKLPDGSGTVAARMVRNGICTQSAVNAVGLSSDILTARQIADRHMAAVFALNLYESKEQAAQNNPSSNATGFFLNQDGVAVTSCHTLEDAAYGLATLITGESYEIERVIWMDSNLDLAVIRVSKTSTTNEITPGFAYLEISDSSEIRPGDIVYTLSNSLGLGLAITSGIVSSVTKDTKLYGFPCVMNTAGISQGSSGGAVLNIYGHVIAVAAGAFRLGNEMYVSVPADLIKSVDFNSTGESLQTAGKRFARS